MRVGLLSTVGLFFNNGLIFQEWAYFKGDRGPIFKGDQELFSRLGLFWQAGQVFLLTGEDNMNYS